MRRVYIEPKINLHVNTSAAQQAIYADSKPVKLLPIITRLS